MSLDGWIGLGIPEEVAEQALQWVARLDSDQVSQEDRTGFMQWLDVSPTNRWAYTELSESWAKLSMLQEVSHLVDCSKVLEFKIPESAVRQTANQTNFEHSRTANPAANSWLSYAAMALMILGLLFSQAPVDESQQFKVADITLPLDTNRVLLGQD